MKSKTLLAIAIVATLLATSVVNWAAALSPAEGAATTQGQSKLLATLRDWRIVTLDPAAFKVQADAGDTVSISLGYTSLDVKIAFRDILAPDAVIGRWHHGVFHQFNITKTDTYAGHVVVNGTEEPDSTVRLILNDTRVEGYVRLHDISYNLQPADFASPVGTEVVYRNGDTSLGNSITRDIDMRGWSPPSANLTSGGGLHTNAAFGTADTIKVALIADDSYFLMFATDNDAANQMVNDFSAVEGVFGNEFNYRFSVTVVTDIPDSSEGTSTDAGTLLTNYITYIDAIYPGYSDSGEFHIAHVFVGKDITTSSGLVFGLAAQNGVATANGVSETQQVDENSGGFFPQENSAHRRWTESHENGHVLGGVHCLADYETNNPVNPFDDTKTIMGTWANPDPQTVPPDPNCADDPTGSLSTYKYNYVDHFSTKLGDNNAAPMEQLTTPRLGVAATVSAPSGASSGTTGVAFQQTVTAPSGTSCDATNWPSNGLRSYAEIDWGDGTAVKPAVSNGFCGTLTGSHTYSNPGSYSVKARFKPTYFHTWGAWSGAHAVTISNPVTATAPSAPQNVGGSSDGSTITVTWSPPASSGSSAISFYRLYRSDPSHTRDLRKDNILTTSFIDCQGCIAAGTVYTYWVTAVNGNGLESPFSSPVQLSTNSQATKTKPTPPQNLAGASNANGITLTWTAPSSSGSSAISFYRLWRSDPGHPQDLRQDNILTTSYTDCFPGCVARGTAYQYWVSAVNADGLESDKSSPVTVTA